MDRIMENLRKPCVLGDKFMFLQQYSKPVPPTHAKIHKENQIAWAIEVYLLWWLYYDIKTNEDLCVSCLNS